MPKFVLHYTTEDFKDVSCVTGTILVRLSNLTFLKNTEFFIQVSKSVVEGDMLFNLIARF